jgi:hypothetical protein
MMLNMKAWSLFSFFLICITAVAVSHFAGKKTANRFQKKSSAMPVGRLAEEGGSKRAAWEWKMLRDPSTGKIPEGIRQQEMEWVRTMPVREYGGFDAITAPNSTMIANAYVPVGPTQNGGRTRAIAFDIRYNGTTNRIMLSGGINGGIFRSTNGGQSWAFVHPTDEVRSVSSLAQDPRAGFQNTWYAGTGEAIGISASVQGAFVLGNGILKSTDNGITWAKLTNTADDNPSNFSYFDIVHRLAVHPTNGHVYAAIQQRIVRSTDGGTTWNIVLSSSTATSSDNGMADIMINKAGTRLFAALSGRNPDRTSVGVWTSATGNSGNWSRMAGGLFGQTDSVPGWRAYDNTVNASGEYSNGWGRVTFALAPSNQNIMYVLADNGQRASSNKAEADLFKCDMTSNPFTWTNASAGLTAKIDDGTSTEDTWFEAQGGYNLTIAIHPTQPNYVFVGGVNLYRSSDGFVTPTNTVFSGGYESVTFDDPNYISHVDYHFIAFDPSNPNRMVVASDGGLAYTENATATRISWANMNSQYQTIQYYHVGIDPTPGSRVYFGGCQDNSTTFRDALGLLGSSLQDSNDHYILVGGDGCQVGMTTKNTSGRQFLFASAQEGYFFRVKLFPPFDNTFYTFIKPSTAGTGEFVTYYHLDEDNTEHLYYASYDTLYRTTTSTTVTPTTGWTMMSGVSSQIVGSIYSMATTRGPYKSTNNLFIGTDQGRVYRLRDPANAGAGAIADNITPSGMTAGAVVSDLAVNPRNHDTLMVVASNYGISSIFWTGNATAASPVWQIVEGNLTIPSVRACAVVAKSSGVEYYAGTSSGLFSTANVNGGSTVWARETGGPMNTAVVNSLAYRWQDNTLLVGTHGNGMFAAYIGNAVNLPTPVISPVRDDPNFIRSAFPTTTSGMVTYRTGNMTAIRKIRVQLTNMTGQLTYDQEKSYRDGTIDIGRLPKGVYILTITSPDRKYQYVRRIIRD